MCRKIIILFILLIYILICTVDISNTNVNQKNINIEIRGETNNQKVLSKPIGTRVIDIIDELDITPNSDLSSISLNHVLYNNEIIYIPSIDKESKYPISINSASIDELSYLPGIGVSIASEIVNYRTNVGSFINLEDLMNVKGIGKKKFESIKELLSL